MFRCIGLVLALGLLAATPAAAQLGDLLTAPKTLFDRAIEARSAGDIAKDNEIVLEANGVMADLGTIKVTTTIYEQVLLVTGLFDDKQVYDDFEKGIRAITGVKKLHWKVVYMSEAEQAKRTDLLSWDETLVMETKGQGRLVGTAGVADVNFRVTADVFATLYLMGRARSQGELEKALARLRDGNGVKKVVNYAIVRP